MFSTKSPPRPEKAIPANLLPFYERQGWWAQLKMNGQYSVLHHLDDGSLQAFGRGGEKHKNWDWTPESRAFFAALPCRLVLCAELLHAKVAGIRDVHYIHDILVFDGRVLYGTSYAWRYALLERLFPQRWGETPFYSILAPNVWLAKNLTLNFPKTFAALAKPEEEGLVLKNPKGVLLPGQNGWSVKLRRPHKNFSF